MRCERSSVSIARCHLQYLEWMGRAVRGDLGESLCTNRPVLEELGRAAAGEPRAGRVAVSLRRLIAIPVGIISAARQDTLQDYVARSAAILGLSVPGFWLGTLVIVLPAIWWGWGR